MITDKNLCLFALVLQVLGNPADNRPRKNPATGSYPGSFKNRNIGSYPTIVANNNIFVNIGKRANDDILPDLCLGVDNKITFAIVKVHVSYA
jgi:hypothetical protein